MSDPTPIPTQAERLEQLQNELTASQAKEQYAIFAGVARGLKSDIRWQRLLNTVERRLDEAEARTKVELETCCTMVMERSLATGHADTVVELMAEVLVQYDEAVEALAAIDNMQPKNRVRWMDEVKEGEPWFHFMTRTLAERDRYKELAECACGEPCEYPAHGWLPNLCPACQADEVTE